MKCENIPFKDIPLHSQLVLDYLAEKESVSQYISGFPSKEGLIKQAKERKFDSKSRALLHNTLLNQYDGLDVHPHVLQNIKAVLDNKTKTITTGHQLCLNTGPLYFIYKIASTIALCKELNNSSDQNFVPVFWMATEDHDFEEIRSFEVFRKSFSINAESLGAVGPMSTNIVKNLFDDLSDEFNLNEKAKDWLEMAEMAYKESDLASATRHLVNSLFGKYGLVVIDANDADLKRSFSNVISLELFENKSFKNVSVQSTELKDQGYKAQVNPREINLFYMKEGLRERIVQEKSDFVVLNTDLRFSEESIKEELNKHPERFSPNVVLRPMYQEFVLPNVAMIGGGGEIAYWMQLRSAFKEHGIDFPLLILRDSALYIRKKSTQILEQNNLEISDLFKATDVLSSDLVIDDQSIDFESYTSELDDFINKLRENMESVSKPLAQNTEIMGKEWIKGLTRLEKKVVKELKSANEVKINKVLRVKEEVLPVGIFQERKINILQILLSFDSFDLDELIDAFNPLDKKLSVFTEE